MSVEVDEETIYVHWVDIQGEEKEDYSKEISGSFEDILGGIFK
jgi:multicomponent Na+:H+ antiporter subunit E